MSKIARFRRCHASYLKPPAWNYNTHLPSGSGTFPGRTHNIHSPFSCLSLSASLLTVVSFVFWEDSPRGTHFLSLAAIFIQLAALLGITVCYKFTSLTNYMWLLSWWTHGYSCLCHFGRDNSNDIILHVICVHAQQIKLNKHEKRSEEVGLWVSSIPIVAIREVDSWGAEGYIIIIFLLRGRWWRVKTVT